MFFSYFNNFFALQTFKAIKGLGYCKYEAIETNLRAMNASNIFIADKDLVLVECGLSICNFENMLCVGTNLLIYHC